MRSIDAVAKANGDGHRWYQLYWCASSLFPAHAWCPHYARRPQSNEVRLFILSRAKAVGFIVLVLTLDTFLLDFQPHDLDTAHLPFLAGVGVQVGTLDSVFTKRMGMAPHLDERPTFPLDMDAFWARLAAGDPEARTTFRLGANWLCNSSLFRSWEDLRCLHDNWEGPIVLKDIQMVEGAHAAMDAQMDGIVVQPWYVRLVDKLD
jgi:lactate 2-monooxygenase